MRHGAIDNYLISLWVALTFDNNKRGFLGEPQLMKHLIAPG